MHEMPQHQGEAEQFESTEERARALYEEWRELRHRTWDERQRPKASWGILDESERDEWRRKAERLQGGVITAITPSEPLQSTADSAINETNPRMSKGKKVQQFDYPPPDTTAELDEIQQRVSNLAHVAHTIASLAVEGVDAAPIQIAGLHEISSHSERLARQIGLSAIAKGKLSQVQLGRLLGVHQATVSRWISEAQQQQASGQ